MRHIFISKLSTSLASWNEAFPESVLSETLPDNIVSSDDEVIFWLHMNEDRQQWMAKTVASILNDYKNAKIVVLANTPNHTESLYALSLGARGYCHAYSEPTVLN